MKTTIGMDLHKHQLNTEVLDEKGEAKERREIPTKCRRQIAEYFGSYGREAEVAVESMGFYQWFGDLVRPQVGGLHLADPAGVWALRKMVRHRHGMALSPAGERPSLRWSLRQSVWAAIRSSRQAGSIYSRFSQRAGAKKAAIALAGKLRFYACRKNTPFHWPDGSPGATTEKPGFEFRQTGEFGGRCLRGAFGSPSMKNSTVLVRVKAVLLPRIYQQVGPTRSRGK